MKCHGMLARVSVHVLFYSILEIQSTSPAWRTLSSHLSYSCLLQRGPRARAPSMHGPQAVFAQPSVTESDRARTCCSGNRTYWVQQLLAVPILVVPIPAVPVLSDPLSALFQVTDGRQMSVFDIQSQFSGTDIKSQFSGRTATSSRRCVRPRNSSRRR